MKNFGLLLLGIILGALAMYFYCNRAQDGAHQVAAMVKPEGVITPARAKILNDNWSNDSQALIDSLRGRPDNRSAWWSVEDLQNYINYAENQAGGLGYEMNGLRMYFGRYSKNAGKGKADYSTIFIVPTGKKIKSDGSVLPTHLLQGGDEDIDDAHPLNDGNSDIPPGNGYGG